MSKKLTFLFAPIDAIGHVNAAIGIAQVLINAGHRVVFVISDKWMQKLTPYGIEEHLITDENREQRIDPAQFWADLFVNTGGIKSTGALETALSLAKNFYPIVIRMAVKLDLILDDVLKTMRPDVVVLDQVFVIPSVVKSGIPWIWTCSFNPLMFIWDERTPPHGSGLPAKGYEKEWKKFSDLFNAAIHDMWRKFNDYVVSRGVEPLKANHWCNGSTFMNIYGFPLELDYLDLRPLPEKWFRFDNLMRTDGFGMSFEIPPELSDKSGKLIYFSMGSMGGADIKMMERLVVIMAKCKHRFIVSKGYLHEKYELPPNMWGVDSVPQIQVLSIVDLVITHGGNNTVTETFYYGKPLIVMPLFNDQYDNAQRIHELGFGVRLDPYLCTEDSLLHSIEYLLSDNVLNERLYKISQRIQTDNCLAKLPKLIEHSLNKY